MSKTFLLRFVKDWLLIVILIAICIVGSAATGTSMLDSQTDLYPGVPVEHGK